MKTQSIFKMEQAGVLAAAAGGEEVGGAKKNFKFKKLEGRDGKVENTILSY
jgi:hypothetical protein